MSRSESDRVGPSRGESDARQQPDALQRQIQRLHVLQGVSQELASELDIDRLLRNILRSAVMVLEAKAGALILLDEMTDDLVFRVVEGGGGEKLRGKRMSRQQGIAGWVLNHQQAVIVDDTSRDKRFYAEIGASVNYATESMICAPLVNRGQGIGVVQVLNKRTGEHFDESDKELLTALAAQSAIAIRNAQLYQNLKEERDRLVALEEDVRKDIARDLHDGPTQLVAAIRMNLDFMRMLLQREPEKVNFEVSRMSSLADRAIRQLRTMLFNLRPVILETKGLLPALEAYSSRMSETEDFTVHLVVQGEVPPLNRQADSAIFAVVQEAVNNAKKYAEASNIWITIRRTHHALEVSVRDDGLGFDTSATLSDYESRGSLGMINMRERAEMLQGSFSIRSAIGNGTVARLVLPLEPNVQPPESG